MSHTMKLWEITIDHDLKTMTTLLENQFGFMPGISIMEAIYLLQKLVESIKRKRRTFTWI